MTAAIAAMVTAVVGVHRIRDGAYGDEERTEVESAGGPTATGTPRSR